jgi:hypothetical protein
MDRMVAVIIGVMDSNCGTIPTAVLSQLENSLNKLDELIASS